MTDNNTGAASGASGPAPTMQMYKEEQAKLRNMLDRRNQLARRLAAIEAEIESKETAYLESTPYGNIIIGFDNYIKGTSGSGAQRRKQGNIEQNRVFSRSSISYRPGNDATASGGSTPASHAPTPQSASFKENSVTSTTASKGGSRKKKQNEEDSEAELQAPNKKRINFGASRK